LSRPGTFFGRVWDDITSTTSHTAKGEKHSTIGVQRNRTLLRALLGLYLLMMKKAR
jgi:hypothetical protein